MIEHKIPLEEFEKKHGTSAKSGLSTEEAERRLI
jgi:hypothetical protein